MSTLLKIGTPIWRKPVVLSAGVFQNTRPALPVDTTADHSEFMGVTTRDSETAGDGQSVPLQRSGDILVRVLGPVSFGDIVGQVIGQDYLSSSSTTYPVGSSLQTIGAPSVPGEATLIKVRTSSASTPSTGFPFQILKVSETQVKVVTASAILRGLDCQNVVNVLGASVPFVVSAGFKIYLEILFDKNQNAFLGSIGAAGTWEGFPRLVRPVKNTEVALEQVKLTAEFAKHVGISSGINATNLALAAGKLNEFSSGAVYKQFYAYALIGFCTAGDGASGLKLSGGGNPFTVVQTLDTNLMLAGFCDAGVPCLAPIPFPGPFIATLPAPIVTHIGSTVSISVSGHSTAKIYYTLDGGTPTESDTLYTTPIAIGSTGSHTVRAIATETGLFNSPVTVLTFNQT